MDPSKFRKPLQNPIAAPVSKALAHGVEYTRTPTLEQWKKDSSVALARRADDRILTRIDEILGVYHAPGEAFLKIQLKVDLFFTLDYWLKQFGEGGDVKKGREPAVYGLYKYTAQTLCEVFGCGINALPEQLELHFGRRISYHGEQLDVQKSLATYLQRSQAAKYRLSFRNGLAYMFTWPGKGTEIARGSKETGHVSARKMKLVLADSRTASNPSVFRKDTTWGGFALSMGRDLYMARHHCGEGRSGPGDAGNFYHSSYLGGDPVMCAGTIRIRNGVILAVANDSGHYRPSSLHFIGLLETLRMFGVNLGAIDVHEFQADTGTFFVTKANVFLTYRGNWARALQYGQAVIKSTNNQAARHFFKERREDEALILRLWRDAAAAGVVFDNASGREYFAGTLLRHYVNSDGRQPFAGAVNSTWILDALDRALGRQASLAKPLPLGQQHGKLPMAPPKA